VESFAEQNGLCYLEVSAKNSVNILNLFRKVAEALVEGKRVSGPDEEGSKDGNSHSSKENQQSKNVTLSTQRQKGEAEHHEGCSC
jgi:hypothetical protein